MPHTRSVAQLEPTSSPSSSFSSSASAQSLIAVPSHHPIEPRPKHIHRYPSPTSKHLNHRQQHTVPIKHSSVSSRPAITPTYGLLTTAVTLAQSSPHPRSWTFPPSTSPRPCSPRAQAHVPMLPQSLESPRRCAHPPQLLVKTLPFAISAHHCILTWLVSSIFLPLCGLRLAHADNFSTCSHLSSH
jgi:hypothetical protein